MKEKFIDNSYFLLRAMYHTKISMEYFESLAKEYNGSAKQLMLSYANKSKYILDNIRHRMPQEMIDEIDNDLSDCLFLDSIEDKIIHFNDQQREMIEQIVDLIYNGNAIEISYKSIDPNVVLPESDF